MIDEFSVQGFKSLEDLTIELGRFNVFIGANGAGKSNLLEAIGVIGAAAFGSVEPETLRYRGVRPGRPSLYKSSFKRTRFRRIITLQAKYKETAFRIGLDNPIVNPVSKWKFQSEALLEKGDEILTRSPRGCRITGENSEREKISLPDDQSAAKLSVARFSKAKQAARLLARLESFAIFSPTTPVLRGIATEEVSRDPVGLTGGGLPQAINEILSMKEGRLGEFDLDDVWELIDWATAVASHSASYSIQSPAVKSSSMVLRFRDRYMRPDRSVLSGYDASEGALYVLFMLTLISHAQSPRMFAVDNFDQALHPRLAAALTKLLADKCVELGNRQVFATTHNPLVLDGLDLSDERIRLFSVDRDQLGRTTIKRIRLSDALLDNLSKTPLSRLWIDGFIGGVPRYV